MILRPSVLIGRNAGGIDPNDYFKTSLWTGPLTGNVNNGLNLSGVGGLVISKIRSTTGDWATWDTVRGDGKTGNGGAMWPNKTDCEITNGAGKYNEKFGGFNSTGFAMGGAQANGNIYFDYSGGGNFVAWTFLKKPKFCDIVTWTGNGSNRTIAHSLGVVPGLIIVKKMYTGSSGYPWVYQRDLGGDEYLLLNNSQGRNSDASFMNNTDATSSVFSLGTGTGGNDNIHTYVAWLFAHDPTGIIQTGLFNTDGSGQATVNLGWEPQFMIIKRVNNTGSWTWLDTTRGFSAGSSSLMLDTGSISGDNTANWGNPTSTGFSTNGSGNFASSSDYIYLAIKKP